MKASPDKIKSTVHTVAVISDLVGAVVTGIAGNDISNHLNKSPITRKLVGKAAVAHVLNKHKVAH